MALLELTRPESPWLRTLYYPYLKIYLPLVGRLVSGDGSAYRFLADSILAFRPAPELLKLAEAQGFSGVHALPLSGGLATLVLARK